LDDAPSVAGPARIGRYLVERKLGQGGMGIVYAARDEQLDRLVAVKTMSASGADDTARRRFLREARAAASVNHPNVCQIHEIGEDAGALFIAMELLEGESLADRLRRGPFSVPEALPIALGMLAALSALHTRGLIHRDLKPTNVFLTPHGVKLLDFGLAKPEGDAFVGSAPGLTRTGIAVGTPRYMAPEQATGDPVDARCDLFAAGAILFEMLSGRPAFGGSTVVDVLHATLREHPPALTGSPAVAAVDRVIRRALAKRPWERPFSADEMADELRGTRGADSDDTPALAQALTRLVVMPFRVLRPDPETDFLAFGLPDAIATSLSRVGSLVVRSSAAAARFAGDAPDLKGLAAEVDVDRVVMGTLIRSGDQLRTTVQLVDAPRGTLLAAHEMQSSLGDLFQLQDDLAQRVVTALALPLAGSPPSPTPGAPHNPRAYEFYLRANDAARTYAGMQRARELYQQGLQLDPRFAPAWAHLGRCHRVIGKYLEVVSDSERQAEDALRHALALDPGLPVAHKFYAQLEADMGRAEEAIVRLLGQAARHGNDPELFAGLVHVCRYGGLNAESLAAHAEARRLDPKVSTGLDATLLMMGGIDRLLTAERPAVDVGADEGIRVMCLGLAGRRDEARRALGDMRQALAVPAFEAWTQYLLAWIERRPNDMMRLLSAFAPLKIQDDPEAMFLEGWLLCDAGDCDAGFAFLRRAVTKGHYAAPTLSVSRAFDPLRSNPAFLSLIVDAEAGRGRARAAFRNAGGDRLLGT
jgi:TolB-like protein